MKLAALACVLVGLSTADRQQLAVMGYDGPAAARKAADAQGPCAGPSDERALIGTRALPWSFSDWINSAPLTLDKLRGRVVVVRFWTQGCAFCERSLPALQQLAGELADQPVTFIGAFHGKPADSANDMTAPASLAKEWGVKFPLALDRQWGSNAPADEKANSDFVALRAAIKTALK